MKNRIKNNCSDEIIKTGGCEMTKVRFVLAALLFVVGSLFVYIPGANAELGYFQTDGDWATEGASDGQITVRSGQDIRIQVASCSRVNWSNHYATPMSVSECGPVLYATVCNPVTMACTSTKNIGSDGIVLFTDMKGATYEIYLDDSWSNYYFRGEHDYTAY
jgi:hypothetical protein